MLTCRTVVFNAVLLWLDAPLSRSLLFSSSTAACTHSDGSNSADVCLTDPHTHSRMKMDLWPGAHEDLLRIARDGCPTRFIGESYPVLEEFLYNNVDTALVSSLIAENSFSMLKRVKAPGAHPDTTDRILAWLMSDRVTRERRKRFGFKTKSGTAQKFPKHLQTQRQWLSWLVSMKVHPSLPLPPSLPIHDPTPISPASHPVMPSFALRPSQTHTTTGRSHPARQHGWHPVRQPL